MVQSVSHLTQSKYYSPAFNAAVFDGPVRIYFAQHQEALALKVYFRLQQHLKETYSMARQNFKNAGRTIFLMLYPTSESFAASFHPSVSQLVVKEALGDDFVLGVNGPLDDEDYESVFKEVEVLLERMLPAMAVTTPPLQEL